MISIRFCLFFPQDCTPVKFWLLSRHGTRLPSGKSMAKLAKLTTLRDEILANSANTELCEQDLSYLKQWKWDDNITAIYDNYLTTQGWDDLKLLAKHYQSIFPEIIGSKYEAAKFQFRYTNTQRTQASFKGFVEGLFGEGADSTIVVPTPPENDTLLRPYDICDIWQQHNDEKDGPDSEIVKFQTSEVFLKMLKGISQRLGFTEVLSFEEIEVIYDMCRFEEAWFIHQTSPWCTAFTVEQITILEYSEDLNYYYKSGYGTSLNQRVPCEAVSDMIKNLNSSTNPTTIAYFTHSTMLQMFLSSLGVGKDVKPLRADNFAEMSNRKWRTSLLGPFTGNLAAVKYECSNGPEKIMFFSNEKFVDFDWCSAGVCNLTDVIEKLKVYTDNNCSTYYCSSSNVLRSSFVVGLAWALLSFINFV